MKKLNTKQFMCVRVAIILLIAYAIAVVQRVGTAYGISWRSFGAFALVVALFAGLFIYGFRDKTEAKNEDAAEDESKE
jgi:high-affinity Fe2+/Pb2+ permease